MTTMTESQLKDLQDLQIACDDDNEQEAENGLGLDVDDVIESWTGNLWEDPKTGRRWYEVAGSVTSSAWIALADIDGARWDGHSLETRNSHPGA